MNVCTGGKAFRAMIEGPALLSGIWRRYRKSKLDLNEKDIYSGLEFIKLSLFYYSKDPRTVRHGRFPRSGTVSGSFIRTTRKIGHSMCLYLPLAAIPVNARLHSICCKKMDASTAVRPCPPELGRLTGHREHETTLGEQPILQEPRFIPRCAYAVVYIIGIARTAVSPRPGTR